MVRRKKLMLLGAGELGKEFAISAQRLGLEIIAVDRYPEAPAMQVAHAFEVIDMLNGFELARAIDRHRPDFVIPEIEAIRTEKLVELEQKGVRVIPTARAVNLTMNRDAIRDVARQKLRLKTADYQYAESLDELRSAARHIGFPCVIKPVMSSSGKGQSVARKAADLDKSWSAAVQGMRGDKRKVIIEEFIRFESEITLLTIKQWKGRTLFAPPIGHRQERGDYQESWMPAKMSAAHLEKARRMARKVTDELGGAGLFGVEFFLTKDDVYFSELSPRPHDTGLVTLVSQDLSEFDLHLRAVLGYPIPEISTRGASASAVILANSDARDYEIRGQEKALAIKGVDLRLFGKPDIRPFRRVGVALARGTSTDDARKKARKAASLIVVEGAKGSRTPSHLR